MYKYFISYQQIVSSKGNELQNLELEELILLTIRDLNVTESDAQLTFEPIHGDQGDILEFGGLEKRYKVVAKPETVQGMFEELDYMTRVANELISHMVKKKEIRDQVFLAEADVLLTQNVLQVFPQPRGKSNAFFKPEFMDENNPELPEKTRKFQKIFIETLKKRTTKEFSQLNESLKNDKPDELRLKVFKNFGEIRNPINEADPQKKEAAQQTKQLKDWPQPASFEELKKYLGILTLAVHQPNEDKLRDFIIDYITNDLSY